LSFLNTKQRFNELGTTLYLTYKAKSNTKFSNEMVKRDADPLNKNIEDKQRNLH